MIARSAEFMQFVHFTVSGRLSLNTLYSADLLQTDLSNEEIPDQKYFTEYGPGFEMKITASNIKNENDSSYLDFVINSVNSNLDLIK